jgi:hypothetical protein
MAKQVPDKDEDEEPLCVATGEHADVYLIREARKEYELLKKRNDQNSIQEARSLERYFGQFAKVGPSGLSNTMFKEQERVSCEGTKVMVYSFKAYQFRIYGSIGPYNGKRAFFGTACDPAKKSNKADSAKLKKAAKEWVGFFK